MEKNREPFVTCANWPGKLKSLNYTGLSCYPLLPRADCGCTCFGLLVNSNTCFHSKKGSGLNNKLYDSIINFLFAAATNYHKCVTPNNINLLIMHFHSLEYNTDLTELKSMCQWAFTSEVYTRVRGPPWGSGLISLF